MTKDEHRSTTRVLSILSALSNTPEGLTLAELSQQLSAPKSSLFQSFTQWLLIILLLMMKSHKNIPLA